MNREGWVFEQAMCEHELNVLDSVSDCLWNLCFTFSEELSWLSLSGQARVGVLSVWDRTRSGRAISLTLSQIFFSFCFCFFVFVCMCVEANGQYWVSFLVTFHLIYWERVSHWTWRLPKSARLAGQWAPGPHLPLSLQTLGLQTLCHLAF